jgi:hypothetical protein
LQAEPFLKGSVEDFARSCILKAVAYEEVRCTNKVGSFERYTDGAPANDQHLLAQLQKEFDQLS